MYITKAPTRTISVLTILFSFGLTSCGGSGSSSTAPTSDINFPAPAPSPDTTLPPPDISLNCINDEIDQNKAFTDASRIAGLCYTPLSFNSDSSTSRISGGIAVADYNSDGMLDLYVTYGRSGRGNLYQQTEGNFFLNVSVEADLSATSVDRGAVFMDINRDGLPDLISVQEGSSLLQVFGNNGDGTFNDITEETGISLTKPAFSVAAGDYDLDGDLDLFFAHWHTDRAANPLEFLWQNQGDEGFVDRSNTVEVLPVTDGGFNVEDPDAEMEYSFTPIFADINNDKYPDMLLAGDFNSSQVLINNGGTGFIDMTTDVISDRAGMGATVADYDNDGDLDWFVSSNSGDFSESLADAPLNGNRLYSNDGFGNFTDTTDEAGVRHGYWAWGSCFADFDNDGYLDLFVVNGYDGMTQEASDSAVYASFRDKPARLYINNGDNTYTERSEELGATHTQMGRGLACFDYDRDGDLDMIIANNGAAPTLLRNNTFSTDNHFINLRLSGLTGNPQGVGARIFVTVAGTTQMIELQLGNNYLSQNPVEAHFGVGTAEIIDSLRIEWPGLGGEISEMENVTVDQFLIVEHPSSGPS
ncbi:MAG: hypothetical protein ACI93R_000804 [Flavobacteriales bacterium]|jgi:hypothetical protein